MNNETNLNPETILNGKYKILKKIAEGAFGKTYLVKNIQNANFICVIKKLKSKFDQPEVLQEARNRFAKEIRTLELLAANPHIPDLLDSFEIDGEFYLVQEWIDGKDIQQEINEKKTLSEIEVINLLKSTLEVLEFVHRQGIIHRDIKPSNLMRRKEDNQIFLIDFGAMKQVSTLSYNSKTQNYLTKIIGTPDYMPLEQLRGTPTFSSDIYSLGLTAIYALTGVQPRANFNDHKDGFQNWWRNTNVSKALVSILNKMVYPDAYKNQGDFYRYQSALEVLQDLEPIFKIGLTLGGRYKIRQYLGGSIWGYTYLAEDFYARQSSVSRCIVKRLEYREISLSQDAEERFNKELVVLKELGDHELIPAFFNEFAQDGDIYFVREFIDGNDLNQEIQNNKHLSEEDVIRLLFDVLTTLKFVHSKRIIHRDIKPSNLIRRFSDGKIFLIDFGAVKEIIQLPYNKKRTTSQSTKALGTEGYMSPEQRSKRPVFASDIYALGMTAIHLLTGKHPEEFQTEPETGNLIWCDQTRVSQELAKILDKMVQVGLGKGERYQSASEVLSVLHRKFNQKKITINNRKKNDLCITKIDLKITKKTLWKISFFLFLLAFLIAIFLFSLTSSNKDRYLFLQGVSSLKEGKYEEAITKFDEVLAIDANNYQALINRGLAQGYLKQYSDMLASCQLAITIQNSDSYAWSCRGEALYNLGKYEEALTSFNRAIIINPRDPYYWFNKAESLLALHKHHESIQAINEAIEIVNQNKAQQINLNFVSAVYSLKGKILREQKIYENAIEVYTKALEYNPNYFPALRDIGISLKNLRKYHEAKQQFDKIIKNEQFTDEQKSQAYYFSGLTWCEQQNYQLAFDAFNKALELKPDYKSAEQAKKSCQS